jgi:hypothetical protein
MVAAARRPRCALGEELFMDSTSTSTRTLTTAIALAACALALSGTVHAQASGTASGQASGNIELGATEPSRVETSGGASASPAQANYGHGHAADHSVSLALQLRLDAINTIAVADPNGVMGAGFADPSFTGRHLLVPIATPGVRILDDALFLGLGLGFTGHSFDNGPNEESRSGFSLSPLASYDVLSNDSAALSLLGWLNLASLGETETCNAGGCVETNDDAFGWGVSLAAGLRGFLTESLAIGGEFGWGFLSVGYDAGPDVFVHGVFGNLFFEASLDL